MSNNFIFLLANAIHLVNSATINFAPTLNGANLELNCSYTLTKNEILYRVILKKDGDTFVQFDDSNKKSPKFTKIDGISDVKLNGGGSVTILNYQNSTWGIFSCNIYYDMKTTAKKTNKKSKSKEVKGSKMVTKKLKLKFQANVKCEAEWKDGRQGLPEGTFVAGTNNEGKQLIFCRTRYKDTTIPGYWVSGNQCLFSYSQDPLNTTVFDVLVGKGFTWQTATVSNRNVPENSLEAGAETSGNYYAGRCSIDGNMYLGKIGAKFYTNYDGREYNTCPTPDVLICKR